MNAVAGVRAALEERLADAAECVRGHARAAAAAGAGMAFGAGCLVVSSTAATVDPY